MTKVMLQEKTAEVEKLNEELRHSECGMKLLQEKISQLNAEIAKLKAGMSPDGSSTALSPIGDGDVQLMTEPFDSLNGTASPPELRGADDVAVDPAVMQEKIKQLTSRISELLNHNRQWEKKCRQLMSEVEAAKRQLVECQQLTEQKLEEERQKTNRAVAERDDALAEKDKHEALCRQLSADVARLEATVRDMEYQGLRSNGPDEEINSERVAYQFQIEEYQRDLEAERESHKRTKAKSESLDQQRNTLLQALNAKKKELNDAKAKMERLQEENRRFQDLLEKANIDRELIQGHLSGHDVTSIGQLRGHDTTKTGLLSGHDVMSTGQSADEAKKMTGDKSRDQRASHSSSKAKPSRGTLEEDRAVAVPPEVRRGGRSEQAARWSCDVCSYYNSGEESPNSCKICTAKRGRVVSYPVQESRVSSAYSEQGALISYKPMSCSGSSSSSKVGRSKLEEDGAVTSRAMRVVY